MVNLMRWVTPFRTGPRSIWRCRGVTVLPWREHLKTYPPLGFAVTVYNAEQYEGTPPACQRSLPTGYRARPTRTSCFSRPRSSTPRAPAPAANLSGPDRAGASSPHEAALWCRSGAAGGSIAGRNPPLIAYSSACSRPSFSGTPWRRAPFPFRAPAPDPSASPEKPTTSEVPADAAPTTVPRPGAVDRAFVSAPQAEPAWPSVGRAPGSPPSRRTSCTGCTGYGPDAVAPPTPEESAPRIPCWQARPHQRVEILRRPVRARGSMSARETTPAGT